MKKKEEPSKIPASLRFKFMKCLMLHYAIIVHDCTAKPVVHISLTHYLSHSLFYLALIESNVVFSTNRNQYTSNPLKII